MKSFFNLQRHKASFLTVLRKIQKNIHAMYQFQLPYGISIVLLKITKVVHISNCYIWKIPNPKVFICKPLLEQNLEQCHLPRKILLRVQLPTTLPHPCFLCLLENCHANTQLSPEIFDPRKKYPRFLQAIFEYFRLPTARNDVNNKNCPSYFLVFGQKSC